MTSRIFRTVRPGVSWAQPDGGLGAMQEVEAGDLADSRILAGLPEAELATLQDNAHWFSCDEGEQFFRQGDAGTQMMFLLEGRVRVLIHAASGQDVAFADIGPGGHFGELSTLDGGSRSASVIAIKPSVVAVVEREAILRAMAVSSRPSRSIYLQDCARILRRSNERVVGLEHQIRESSASMMKSCV